MIVLPETRLIIVSLGFVFNFSRAFNCFSWSSPVKGVYSVCWYCWMVMLLSAGTVSGKCFHVEFQSWWEDEYRYSDCYIEPPGSGCL